jgi:hypothetical protein
MRPTNSGLVIHAHRAVGSSIIPPGSRIGGSMTPGSSSTAHLPYIVGSRGSDDLEVDCQSARAYLDSMVHYKHI